MTAQEKSGGQVTTSVPVTAKRGTSAGVVPEAQSTPGAPTNSGTRVAPSSSGGGVKGEATSDKSSGDKKGGSSNSTKKSAVVGISVILSVIIVSLAAFVAHRRLPADSLLRFSKTSSVGDDIDSLTAFQGPVAPNEKFTSAVNLSPEAFAVGEAVATAMGGIFAGFMHPGTNKVRPPQVISRAPEPESLMSLSDLNAGGADTSKKRILLFATRTSTGGEANFESDFLADQHGSSAGHIPGMDMPWMIGANRRPKVDLIVCMDASGSLSWSEYRIAKETFTRPGGLLDSLMSAASEGSRIAFIEYAYDSVVVSELDDNVDRVKRRVLSCFQGDANNWDRNCMYIYEEDKTFGGNSLRKASILNRSTQWPSDDEDSSNAMAGERIASNGRVGCDRAKRHKIAPDSLQPSQTDLENYAKYRNKEREKAQIAREREVPPAMNGLSREVHLALKWSRLEMLPPLVDRKLEHRLQRANRLRRVLIVNAGDFTHGGLVDDGLSSAREQVNEMEGSNIAVITVGIGSSQEPSLESLATGDPAAHFALEVSSDIETIMADIIHMILSPRFQSSQSKRVQEPARAHFTNKKHRTARSVKPKPIASRDRHRNIGPRMTAERKLLKKLRPRGSLGDRDKFGTTASQICDPRLSRGELFRSESDLPPWFRPEQNA
jgi:hypothetical protein